MRVKDWISTAPVTVTPEISVAEARHLMRLRGVRHLPVVEGDRVAGMLSDRDVRITDDQLETLAGAENEHVEHVAGTTRTAQQAMSSPAHVISPEASIHDASRVLLSRRISALPVVDDDGALVGLLTTTDCLLAFLSPHAEAEDPPSP